MKKFNIDSTKILGIGVAILGIAGTILSSIKADKDRDSMKLEIKDEILKSLNQDGES